MFYSRTSGTEMAVIRPLDPGDDHDRQFLAGGPDSPVDDVLVLGMPSAPRADRGA